MTIRVKLFAVLREVTGVSEAALELPADATVADARRALAEKLPALGARLSRVAFAVNLAYADASTPLHEGDELAALPPVSGG